MVVPLRDSLLAPLAILALAKLALHLATSGGYGFFRDELYYLVSTDHLAWGYVEHPPLSIALLWLSRQVLGDSLIAIRSLPAVAGAATVFVAGLLARELGGGRRA
jgi:predicted membrane-bound mannosyltransferase